MVPGILDWALFIWRVFLRVLLVVTVGNALIVFVVSVGCLVWALDEISYRRIFKNDPGA
jgi:hypothetical protein